MTQRYAAICYVVKLYTFRRGLPGKPPRSRSAQEPQSLLNTLRACATTSATAVRFLVTGSPNFGA